MPPRDRIPVPKTKAAGKRLRTEVLDLYLEKKRSDKGGFVVTKQDKTRLISETLSHLARETRAGRQETVSAKEFDGILDSMLRPSSGAVRHPEIK